MLSNLNIFCPAFGGLLNNDLLPGRRLSSYESYVLTSINYPTGTMDSNITLWQFLFELLVGGQHKTLIQWVNDDGEFKLLDAEKVAKLWGLRKNKVC